MEALAEPRGWGPASSGPQMGVRVCVCAQAEGYHLSEFRYVSVTFDLGRLREACHPFLLF